MANFVTQTGSVNKAMKIWLSNDAVRASNYKTQASHFSLFKSA